MVKYIKLQAGQSIKGMLVSPKPTLEKGKYGLQHNYTLKVNGEDNVLQLSESSPANNSFEMINAGEIVVVKKVDLGGGKTAWNVSPADDISNLPINQGLKSGAESFQEYIDTGSYAPVEPITRQDVIGAFSDKDFAIAVQSARKDACLFLAEKKDSTSDDVLAIADKFLTWYKKQLNG